MKNKKMEKAFNDFMKELQTAPESRLKDSALAVAQSAFALATLLDDDSNYNPPGKVVVRDESGRVVGLQG